LIQLKLTIILPLSSLLATHRVAFNIKLFYIISRFHFQTMHYPFISAD